MISWQKKHGLVDYKSMLEIMDSKVQEVIGGSPDAAFLLEHDHIYTAGTSFKNTEILDNNIKIIDTGRGGKITYHGPGQRVIYPILNLNKNNRNKDLKLYIRNLEHWIIDTLSYFAIKSYIVPNRVGIWVDGPNGKSKIAAIGIRVRKWVTYHGIAINISPDLSKYKSIIPCGIDDAYVTSMKELGINISLEEFDAIAKKIFDI